MKAFFCLICILAISCTKNRFPDDIIIPDKMADVFWDVLRADIYASDYLRADTTKSPVTENIILQKKIFAKHGVSKAQYDKSFDYYTNQPQLMTALLDTILAREKRVPTVINKKATINE